jgi:hypothetical protein
MPPKAQTTIYRVRFCPKALAAAAAEMQTRSTGSWRTAYGKALAIASGHPRIVHITSGRLFITSPRSGHVYEVSAASCPCEARGPCWHLALVRSLIASWRAARPVYRCGYCGGPMKASRTVGGERSYVCLCCEHEAHISAVEGLAPWAEQPVAARAA